jgi:NAD(P)-dependent dehydrogenase (short-subunit alcohol dehydrogenase family)
MKTILLIGADGGMGSACARLFCKNGDRVIGIDRAEMQMPDEVIPIHADLADPEQIAAAFETAVRLVQSIDAVVYAAGIYDADSLVEIDDARMKRIFDVNLFGAYRILHAFLPLLKHGARIVFVTSELADLDPLPFTGLYGITKATLDRFAFSLAMELQMLGMRVSVLRPGAVKTVLLNQSVDRIKSFTEGTKLYPGVAAKFLSVTNRFETKAIPPARVAKKITSGQRLYLPLLQNSHFPQVLPGSSATRSPTLRCFTSLPTSMTVPPDSWPRTRGAFTMKSPIRPASK